MQASLYDWIVYQRRYKARERKGERKTGSVVGSYKYLRRAAKALVISELMTTWQNMAEVLYNPLSRDSRSTKFYRNFSTVFHLCRNNRGITVDLLLGRVYR